jgi:hypothetical protein
MRRYYQRSSKKFVIKKEASWIPRMLPELLQVDHRPAKRPRDFLGNQWP